MNARILALDSDEHHWAQANLPWHVNGTLDPVDGARLQAHLAGCARCQADAEAQRRLAAWPIHDDRAEAIERDWAALRQRLDAPAPGVAADLAPAPRTPPARPAHPRAASARPSAWRPAPPRWFAWLFGAQALIVLLLALVLLPWQAVRRDDAYRTLGNGPPDAGANALVVFRPDASEAQIRRALRAAEARIVGGPTVTDAYLLRFGGPADAGLRKLRADMAVQRVESLDGAPR